MMLRFICCPRALLAVLVLPMITALPAGGQVMYEDIKLVADDGGSNDWFGQNVAISDKFALVGATRILSFDPGSADLFDITTGKLLFRLEASDFNPFGDNFGRSLAISGTTAIIGSRSALSLRGSVYVFDLTTGQELFKLTPSDAVDENSFGGSVSISGSTAIIGDIRSTNLVPDVAGAVYLFDTTTGEELMMLTASDASAEDYFGSSVAMSGTTAIVGAPRDSDAAYRSGSAYLIDTTTGEELFKLVASDATAEAHFGRSVAISGTTAIVGANKYGGDSAGSAYLFDTVTGKELFKLTAPASLNGGAAGNWFGESVAISGTTALVGMPADNATGLNNGTVFMFDTNTGELIEWLVASDGEEFDLFGDSVAIWGTNAIVGAPYDDFHGVDTGSAYLFYLCPADLNGDGSLNFFDVSAFLDAFAVNDPAADFTDDGLFNFFDVSAFLSAFAAGCP